MHRLVATKKTVHFIILYILIAVLFAIAIMNFSATQQATGDWVCVQETCIESEPAGEEWAAQNCGEVETDQGEIVMACVLVIDGIEQLVPMDALNLSAIQSCTLYQCLQEVPVRQTDYTFTP